LIWHPDDVFWRGFYEDFLLNGEGGHRIHFYAIKAKQRKKTSNLNGFVMVREKNNDFPFYYMSFDAPQIDSTHCEIHPAYIFIYAELNSLQ
jgi:hypothetical protein